MDKEILLSNIDKVHTTEMGIDKLKLSTFYYIILTKVVIYH